MPLLCLISFVAMYRMLDSLISEEQNVFMEGRQMLDAFLIVNEAIDSRLRYKEKRILCKLDIEKAYNNVN